MLREIEHDMVGTQTRDSTPDAREIVLARQVETLSVAWLLTGNRNHAFDLTEAAFVSLFHDLNGLEPHIDLRSRLLVHLARAFLRDTYPATPATENHDSGNLRDRTLTTLKTLGRDERAALILSDMCGINPDELVERPDNTPATPIEPARQRVRESLDIPADNSLRPLLVEAGFDGPRHDLWPVLERRYAEIERRTKRRRQLLSLGVAGAVVLTAAISIAAIFGPGLIDSGPAANTAAEQPAVAVEDLLTVSDVPPALSTPTPVPARAPTGDVPNTLLVQASYDQRSNNAYTVLSAYDPANNGLRPIHDDGVRVSGQSSHLARISPDGRQIVVLHEEWTAAQIRVSIAALDSTTFERQWEAEVGSFARPDENSGRAFRLATTISTDHFYVAFVDEHTPTDATILAFDRQDGALRKTRAVSLAPLEIEQDIRGNVYLYVSPNEDYLTLALDVWSYDIQDATSTHMYRLALPSLTRNYGLVAQGYPDPQRGFNLWGANPTPDGCSLYSLANWRDQPPQVEFLNLESGGLTVIDLPLTGPENYDYTPTTSVVSHDGGWLYVLEQTGGTVAIVNLTEQRLERSFPLDVGTFGGMFGTGPNRRSLGFAAELSPDGSLLYLNSGSANETQGRKQAPGSGVWVIDTRQWRIVDFWPSESYVGQIFSTPGKSTLMFASHYDERERTYQSVIRIGAHDDAVIEEAVAIPGLQDNNIYTLTSLTHLYRKQYGRSPTVAGEDLRGPYRFETLPRIEASATTASVAAGVETAVEVRILDPAGGEILDTPRPDVRFDPDATITAILTKQDQPGQIVVLAHIEAGIYRGSVTLPAQGTWSIDVAMSAWGEPNTLTSNAGEMDVAPTFLGSDGRQYQFAMSLDPETPELEQETTVQLRLVDVESGVPLPDDVDLNVEQPAFDGSSIEGMPERIDVSFYTDTVTPDTYGGFRTALLYRISPGRYEGTASFWQSGPWTAEIRFQPPGALRVNVPAGTIEVVEPPGTASTPAPQPDDAPTPQSP